MELGKQNKKKVSCYLCRDLGSKMANAVMNGNNTRKPEIAETATRQTKPAVKTQERKNQRGKVNLEKHGFDIAAPRSKIDKLLSIKESQTRALEELKVAAEKDNKRRKLEDNVEQASKKIVELQRQEALMKEEKVTKEKEIARMKYKRSGSRQNGSVGGAGVSCNCEIPIVLIK
ncbi:uncharacterized protein LOC130509331 [Raphanus sativus]|uniref:Uncharacterized protein LOC130509331 n=1 Tax=Raphanus sativus TaxID=3726 RepID=A0A9W3DBD4_RAPSA|nr:uncharacterized protein LOC130509331 [Raphanus sativus]XP_056861152.1 uncharacterized protein LOC130509331 [Raphanus sativus]